MTQADLTPADHQPGLGLFTLYMREVRRFMKIPGQTVVAPAITTMLFMAVFALALGRAVNEVEGVPFLVFLAPGLVMMAMLQNSFANSSSSLIIAKVQGNIVDLLMPPLGALELLAGLALGAATRGLVVGAFVLVVMQAFVLLPPADPLAVIYYAVMACLMMALMGLLVGIWAEKFDQIAALTNFFITPLTFLSGTFYSISRLPDSLQFLAHANPFFYAIDGFRYGFTGQADGSLLAGALFLAGFVAVLGAISWVLLEKGVRLKA